TELRFVRMNERLAEINGVPALEHIGRTVREVLPQLSAELEPLYQQVIQSGLPILNYEISGMTRAQPGIERIWLANYYPLKGADEQVLGVNVVVQEITERKFAEQKIQEQAALLEVATDAIFVRDLEHQILFWNKSAERLYGWQKAEILGKKATETFCLGLLTQIDNAIATIVEFGSWQGELHQVTKEGKNIVTSSRWTLVRDEAGQPKSILVANTDITEKKQLEAQFLRAQRLENLGILAGGITHDLNNILQPILTAAQLLKLKFPDADECYKQILLTLETNARRGADLVKQILSFARGTEGKQAIVQVRHLLKDVEQLAKQTFPKSIEIKTDIPSDLWTVCANVTQLHQVLTNLVVNARDAMPDGGTLSLCAVNLRVDEIYASTIDEAKVGDYVVVTVADTGCGIPPEIIDRIFDLFFTTKELNQGTGLGLSTVLGIMKNHGGFVQVESKVGKGSQFRVYLPAGTCNAERHSLQLELISGRGELILIVDDEAAVQQITQTSLEAYNYRTLIASDGIEAIALFVQHKQEISAVLMDMTMPLLDGLNAIRTLQRMAPQVKIIATSGLASNSQLAEAAGINVQAFLSKPYTLKELLDTLNRILTAP
ncbi:PAS domain-containing protein, partial [Chroococcidiopsidales cyanobacterium LEGE 13417]|nr:PAS domain-containing protein [Chroococcidiopsidales cyanobacterium LEGE 13417]